MEDQLKDTYISKGHPSASVFLNSGSQTSPAPRNKKIQVRPSRVSQSVGEAEIMTITYESSQTVNSGKNKKLQKKVKASSKETEPLRLVSENSCITTLKVAQFNINADNVMYDSTFPAPVSETSKEVKGTASSNLDTKIVVEQCDCGCQATFIPIRLDLFVEIDDKNGNFMIEPVKIILDNPNFFENADTNVVA